jgi:hypothetical protein
MGGDMKRAWISVLLLLLGLSRLAAQSPSEAPATEDHSMHHHHDIAMADDAANPAVQAKLLADKKESEFNHHLAGFFVALGAAFILSQTAIERRWRSAQYIWPLSFLLSGLFVMIWSDTELWPFGKRQWAEALHNNPEVFQHKMFAILLLGLGTIEWLRTRGTLQGTWSALVFPFLAVAGSILLLFHQHESGMHGANHMELMARIQSEHWTYAMVGVGIGLSKGLAEVTIPAQKIFAKLWPLLMLALGILLTLYRE